MLGKRRQCQSETYQLLTWGLRGDLPEIGRPVVVGVDARSLLLSLAARARDENTWGFICGWSRAESRVPVLMLLRDWEQGESQHLGDTPCHGDPFHIQQQCQSLANVSSLVQLEQKLHKRQRKLRTTAMELAKHLESVEVGSPSQTQTNPNRRQAVQLSRDVKNANPSGSILDVSHWRVLL